jgi:hypothetical protein
MYGIQSMNFQMNIAPKANRAWRSAVFEGTKEATVVAFNDSQLIFQFLTPHPSDMLESRNVVPYYELPIYKTLSNAALPARPNFGQPIATGVFVEAATVPITSSNIQLNGIPDKLIIFARKPIANLTCADTDSYATIKSISINFNNQAGLLSSMTPEQLYRNSVNSGLANMSWDEFCGSCVNVCGTLNDTAKSRQRGPFEAVGANLSRTLTQPGADPPTR